MDHEYPFRRIEEKWQARWRVSTAPAGRLPVGLKRYCLDMFPYPSGVLHMGHVRNYAMGDCVARTFRMQGFSVLYPMGWDAFGLPAENEAILNGTNPREWTERNIAQMKQQMLRLGISYDWANEISTCEPEYYRWNQWIFLKLLERGLCERRMARVNWCPSCSTVLANEQVISGACWRCHSTVQEKSLVQWFLRTTAYARDLLTGLDEVDFPARVKALQRNWIGFAEGARVKFTLEGLGVDVDVFTPRPEALFGATFLAIGPDHPFYPGPATPREGAPVVSTRGAMHPLTGRVIPIIGVALDEEHGGPAAAAIGIPAHDEWSYRLAQTFGISIQPVVDSMDGPTLLPYTGPGRLIDSGIFTGMSSEEAREKVIERLISLGRGERAVSYRLRDWLISRQRYWGTPIPVIHCPTCGIVPVPYAQLPVILPTDVRFGEGNPLDRSQSFRTTTCPKCGGPAQRDTDTMDTFVDSSWYFLRFCHPVSDGPFDAGAVSKWMPVDVYIGGMEHATLHLLYARFMTRALRDLGLISASEPFRTLVSQGVVTMAAPYCEYCAIFLLPIKRNGNRCANCGREFSMRSTKMSKSLHNTVSPEEIIDAFGADTARFFILSAANPGRDLEWSSTGVSDAHRLLVEVWQTIRVLALEEPGSQLSVPDDQVSLARARMNISLSDWRAALDERLFQECCRHIREFHRNLQDYVAAGGSDKGTRQWASESLTRMLNPFAPHIAHELWELLGYQESVETAGLPEPEPGWSTPVSRRKARIAEGVLEDVRSIVSSKAHGKVRRVVLTVADEWKYNASREVSSMRGNGTLDRTSLTKALIASGIGPADEVSALVKATLREGDTSSWIGLPDAAMAVAEIDRGALEWAAPRLSSIYHCVVEVRSQREDTSTRARRALPGRPAITIEWADSISQTNRPETQFGPGTTPKTRPQHFA